MSVAERIASLAPEQRALFEKLLSRQQQAAQLLKAPPVPRVSGPTGEGDWPLSFDQERYWFVEQLSPGRAGLNITAATRMHGPVAVPVVAAALAEIVRRHAAWRTSFPVVGGLPVQRVAAPRSWRRERLAVVDLAALPAGRREAEALRLVAEDAAAQFDVESGPLVRSSLVRMDARDHLCLLTVHHLVTDWISFQIVWGELAALCADLASGRRPALPEPPVQYADFAVWQRGWLAGEVLDALVSWWRGALDGFPLALDLPTDRPRPALLGMRGGRREVALPEELSAGLRALARREEATLFMAVLAATAALAGRVAGQERLLLGANNANRNRPEIEPVVGCFLTQVPFAVDLAGDPTFRELLARARQTALGAFAHQDLPFGKLVEAIQPQRDPSRQPLIQALVQVLDGQGAEAGLAGVRFEAVDAFDGNARYELLLTLFDYPDRIVGSLEHDADLFDGATVERWIELLRLQLAAAVADPGVRLSALPALSEAARHQMLAEWNDTAAGPLSRLGWTVPERLAEQAAHAPDAVALVQGGTVLTHGWLDRRAEGVAAWLRGVGVGQESRVALLLDRSLDAPVAILGTWKAGGACVPLDPGAPAERIAALLADVEPAAVIHRGPLPVAVGGGMPTLDLGRAQHEQRRKSVWVGKASPEGQRRAPAAESDRPSRELRVEDGISRSPREAAALHHAYTEDERSSVEGPTEIDRNEVDRAELPRALAYLIYTSGTTGLPKAVMVEHRSLAATLAAAVERLGLGPDDRMPVVSRPTFDISLLETFAPLLAGGAVEILAEEQILDPGSLMAAVERATRIHGVPALLRGVAAAATAGAREAGERGSRRFAGLRSVLVGGDAVPPDLQAQLLAVFPSAEFDVLYGPTEATIICAAWRVARGRLSERAPVGRPLLGVELLVMDVQGEPVPLGVPGELWIGGPGVARGYFRRDELTAERFVERGGRRFYRTGDLVRHVPAEGALEFLGRTDHQVKVRGFRIEPGEVEAALAAHPAVAQALVVAWPDGAGDRRLVAYCVPAAGGTGTAATGAAATGAVATGAVATGAVATGAASSGAVAITAAATTAAELRAHLAARLPAYMVPSVFVLLPELPLTRNGKVDRARLPAPEEVEPAGAAGAGPATPLEEVVAGVWCAVLGLPRVSRQDDFFALGGHSLLATQVASRLRAATGAELPIPLLFQATTVAALAAALEAALADGASAAAAPPISSAARGGDLPLSFAQERLWFLDRLAPGNAAYNIPLVLAARGELSLPALEAAIGAMVRRHEVLRTTYPMRGGRPVQAIAPPAGWRLPVVDLAELPGELRRGEAGRLVGDEVERPFDLAHGPVLRNLAVRLGPAEHLLLVVVHHVAADGWSMGVMVEELAALYPVALGASGSHPAPAAPPPMPAMPPVQYADFAVWQRAWLSGEVLARQLAYWRERLAGLPVLDLPTDRPRPPVQSFRGATRTHAVRPATARGLAELARASDATLFMVLLAAVQHLLGRYAGQEDVALGSPIAGRTRAEVEPLIGFFVNTLVLRGDLSGDPPFTALLARARQEALAAYAHQDLPFERLVEDLRPERRPAHNPLFQALVVLQNAPARKVELPGVGFAAVDFELPAARFDLEVSFSEEDEVDGGGLMVRLTYGTDLFDAATILRLAGHLDALLAAVAEDPSRPLSRLPLLSAPERHQVTAEWSDTAAELPRLDLAALFFEQARQRPDAVAVTSADGDLTYGELAHQAARLAGRLRSSGRWSGRSDRDTEGLGPEVRAALLAQRSPEMIVGILGILAAGGAYVPLDPSYPAERLAFMLADSGARVLLGQRELLAAMPEELAAAIAGLEVVELGAGPIAQSGSSDSSAMASLPLSLDPDRLAYVMYTSGSTGRPKGVAVTHRNVVRLVRESGFADLGPGQVFLQLAPISFDASTLELWAPLVNGGRLALFPPRRPSLAEVGEAIARQGVTSLWLTAGLFHQMVDDRLADLAPLRQLLAGGDVLSPPHVRRALAGLPGVTVINGYGPTEVTTFTCCHAMTAPSEVAASVPLGHPIGNTRVRVLGPDMGLLPAGVWGELWAGGEGVSRGYLGRPDLTAERFLPDPFAASGEAGARLYRTGDEARFLPDGRIEFRGRRDGQVKLRGFRIELGEIESALARHPAVAAAAVAAMPAMPAMPAIPLIAARPESAGITAPPASPAMQEAAASADRRLVAYVVPRRAPVVAVHAEDAPAGPTAQGSAAAAGPPSAAGETPDSAAAPEVPSAGELAAELRRFLTATLPDYMIPSVLVPLDALPLTPNGKVDRARLPAPESLGEPAAAWVPPATPLEELIARTTAAVLGLERAGMRDNFFALGGHSLAATRLVSRLEQEHGLPVDLQMVFDAADLGELADRIVERELAGADSALLAEALGEVEGLSPEELEALLGQAGLPEGRR